MARRRRVDMERLPSNNLLDEDDKRIDIQGSVSRHTPKLKTGFSSDIRQIAVYLYEEVILPAVKGIITDFVTNGIDIAVWGDRNTRRGRSRGSRVNYSRSYNDSSNRRRREPRFRSRNTSMDLDDIVFTNRPDAERTLAAMMEYIAEYGWVTVGDLYSFVGWTPTHTLENYGWDRLRSSRIIRISDGFSLDLPEPKYRK